MTLRDSAVHVGKRGRTGICIARLKTSVWKGQSFKITARPRVICERSLNVPIAAAFCRLFTIGLKCSARSFAPTKSVAWKERRRESNFYIKAATITGEHIASQENLTYQADGILFSVRRSKVSPVNSSFSFLLAEISLMAN